jgi:hypothetical protein
MCNTPVEVQFTSAGCLNYPGRTPVDPVHVEAMRSAFHKVCRLLQLRDDADDPVIDLIVMKIVEHAKAGEFDPDRLCSQVLLELAARK